MALYHTLLLFLGILGFCRGSLSPQSLQADLTIFYENDLLGEYYKHLSLFSSSQNAVKITRIKPDSRTGSLSTSTEAALLVEPSSDPWAVSCSVLEESPLPPRTETSKLKKPLLCTQSAPRRPTGKLNSTRRFRPVTS